MVELKPEPGDTTVYGIRTVESSRLVPDPDSKGGVPHAIELRQEMTPKEVWGYRTPTLMQHIMMPWSKPPRSDGVSGPIWKDPKLEQLKKEVKTCTYFMVTIPLLTFFYVRYAYWDWITPNEDLWSGMAAVVATQITISCIAIWKYREDFMLVLNGQGNVPYEEIHRQKKAASEQKPWKKRKHRGKHHMK